MPIDNSSIQPSTQHPTRLLGYTIIAKKLGRPAFNCKIYKSERKARGSWSADQDPYFDQYYEVVPVYM